MLLLNFSFLPPCRMHVYVCTYVCRMTTILEVQEEIRKVQGELEEVRKRLQEEVPEPERMHLWKKEELLMKEKEQLRQKELLLMQAGQSTALIQHATHWNLAPQQQTVHTTTTTPYSGNQTFSLVSNLQFASTCGTFQTCVCFEDFCPCASFKTATCCSVKLLVRCSSFMA